MGWSVKAYCKVELTKGELDKETKEKIKGIIEKEDSSDILFYRDCVDFELYGTKGVDYSVMENIKEILKNKGFEFTITATEFAETDDGYYYDSADE